MTAVGGLAIIVAVTWLSALVVVVHASRAQRHRHGNGGRRHQRWR
jgi:hypothetical protein